MKCLIMIFCIVAIASPIYGQTGKTVWTKGGHTSAVKHLYFDDAGKLVSSGGAMAGRPYSYGGFINDPSIYTWDIFSANINESYYSGTKSYFFQSSLIEWNSQEIQAMCATNSLVAGSYEQMTFSAFSTQQSEYFVGSNIFVFDRASGVQLDSIFIKQDSNVAFALHPLKKEIAYRSGASEIAIRDIYSKKTTRILEYPGVLAIEYSPDGNLLAVATRDSGVILWNIKIGAKYFQYPHNKPISRIKFFKENRYLLGVDTAGEVLFCNTFLGILHKEPSGHNAAVTGIATSGSSYSFSSLDSTVSVWNLEDATFRHTISFKNGVTSVAFKNDGQTLAVGLENGDIEITGFGGENRRNLSVFKGNAESVSVSPDKSSIAVKYVNSVGRPENYQLLNFTDGNLLKDIQTPQRYWRLVESKDHNFIAFVRNDSVFTAQLGDTVNLNFITKVIYMSNGLDDVQLILSPDSKTLAITSVGQSSLKFWNLETKQQLGQIPKPLGIPKNSFSPDGAFFYISDTARINNVGGIAVYRMSDFSRVSVIPLGYEDGEISSDNSFITLKNKKSVYLWDLKNNELLKEIILDSAYHAETSYMPGITDVKFTPDSKYLAIVQQKIYLWDIAEDKVAFVLNDPKAPEEFSKIDFSKDGHYLVSAGKSVRLWDLNGITSVENETPFLKTTELLKVFPNPSNGILTLQLDSFKNISGGEIKIYNTLGILLKTVPTGFLKEMNLDCSEFSVGVYFVELSAASGVISRTSFIIAH